MPTLMKSLSYLFAFVACFAYGRDEYAQAAALFALAAWLKP